MNYYILVEGKAEFRVYPDWIKWANPKLKRVYSLDEIKFNNFYIFSGEGYPQYKTNNIPAAIEDCNCYKKIDQLVIAADSEEMSFQEKFEEISLFVQNYQSRVPIRIIIQHFCIECWGLANRVIIRRNPQQSTLIKYIQFFNVTNNDPELLPPYSDEDIGRVEFAYRYLHKAINDRNLSMTYSKSNPRVLKQNGYIDQIFRRLQETGHISSFQSFLNVFKN